MKCERLRVLLLAAAGGMIEAFSLTRLDGVFSNAQSANLLLGVLAMVQGDRKKALLSIASVSAYILGTVLCGMAGSRLRRRNWRIGCLAAAEAVLAAAVPLSTRAPITTVILLALLCSFCLRGLCAQPEARRKSIPWLKIEMVLTFGLGVLAGTMLLSQSDGFALAATGIVLFLSSIPKR